MEKNSRFYRAASLPHISRFYQWLIGANSARARLCKQYLAQLGSGAKVLDIGCESGDLSPFINTPLYTGIDKNALAIKEATRKHGGRGCFVHADAIEYLENEGDQFDVILASGLIHHMADAEVERFLYLVSKRLLPGGKLVAIDPVYHENQNFFARLAMRLDRGGNIRNASGYSIRYRMFFPYVTSRVHKDILRIPYSHYVTQCKND